MFDEITTVLPRHSTDFERALEQASLWVVRNSEIVDIWNPDSVPAKFLPWLAWSVSVDEWGANWSAERKRDSIRNSIAIHRLKGTKGAVRRALDAMGFGADMVEWFEDGSPTHTFRIDAFADEVRGAGYEIGPALYEAISRQIDHAKPARSHFTLRIGEQFKQRVSLRTGLYHAVIACRETIPMARPEIRLKTVNTRSGIYEVSRLNLSHLPLPRQARQGGTSAVRSGQVARATSRSEHRFRRRGFLGDAPTGVNAEINRQNVFRRIEQLASYGWTPLRPVPGARSRYPEMIPAGVPFTGPPYSSVKLFGYTVGQDVSIETFLSAAANPDSVLYGIDLWDIAPTGRAFYGAVCSNFIAYGFGWEYSPTTSILSRDWHLWGFKAEINDFVFSDIENGDVVVTDGGGHIEYVESVTDHYVILFDQTFDGVERTTWTKSAFIEYKERRGYKLLKFDYESVDIDYQPNRFSPIRDEITLVPTPNDVLLTQRGNKANYMAGDIVRFNIMHPDARRLIVKRGEATVTDVILSGEQVVSRPYSVTGNYSARCIMEDGSESQAEVFKVVSISASSSVRVIRANAPVTVEFETDGVTATNLILETVRRGSFSNGVLQEIVPENIENGQVTFSHHVTGEFNIRLRGVNEYGAVFTVPVSAMPLSIIN